MFQLQGRSRAAFQSSPCMSHSYPSVTGGEIPTWISQLRLGKADFQHHRGMAHVGPAQAARGASRWGRCLGKVHGEGACLHPAGREPLLLCQGGVKQSGDGAVTEENEALSWAQAQLQEGCVRTSACRWQPHPNPAPVQPPRVGGDFRSPVSSPWMRILAFASPAPVPCSPRTSSRM